MATRTVSVKLQADVGQYVSGMGTAAKATAGLGSSVAQHTGELGRSTEATSRWGKMQSGVLGQVASATGLTTVGFSGLALGATAVAGGIGLAISKSMDFEKSMSAVKAATMASSSELKTLRDAAMKAGADTQYSATEAADGITEMAKAGVSAKDIVGGGLTGALNLAAAGQISVADASETAATALSVFGLQGNQMSHVADLLSAGAGKAQGSVDDLSQAMNQSALVAKNTGLSIDDTVGALAEFANNGLLGSDAGTSFKTMLQNLNPQSKQAAELMDELNIHAYDAQGKFVGLDKFAQNLKDSLGGLSQEQRNSALQTLFGSDAIRAATILYQDGAKGVDDWKNKVNDAGYAQKQAAALTDNLSGDIERLGGSFDTLLITIGGAAEGPMRVLVQALGGIVDGVSDAIGAFNDLPGPVQLGIGALGALALLNGPLSGVLQTVKGFGGNLGSSVGGAMSTFSEALGYAKQNGDGLGTVLKSTASYAGGQFKNAFGGLISMFGGPWGLAITGATALIPAFISGIESMIGPSDRAKRAQETLTDALKQTNGAIDENARTAARNALSQAGIVDTLSKVGVSSKDAIDGLLGSASAQDRVNASIQDYINENPGGVHNKAAEAARNARQDYEGLSGALSTTRAESKFFGDQASATADTTKAAADKTSAAAQQTQADADAAAKAIQDWINNLAQIGTSFVEPVSIYQNLLQAAAQKTADATKDSKDSWQNYADSAKVSLDQFSADLQNQITAQENWRSNLAKVAERAGYDVAAQLASMGQQGAGLVAQMANSTDSEMRRMAGLMRQDASLGSQGAAQELDQGMKIMAAIGAAGGKATANSIATQLGLGIGQVEQIAAQYGVKLADGINPVLDSLGKTRIVPGKSVVAGYGHFDVGGYTGDGAKHEPKGIVHGGEFVFTKEQTAKAGVGALYAMANTLSGYSGGGFVAASDVPRPPSTAPYRPPISTAADGTMGKGYDETVAWLKANVAPMMARGGIGGTGQWSGIVLQALAMLGQPASLLNTVLARMNMESGGNQYAVNNWDINAKRGTPSKGLMQVIDPTFRANAYPGRGGDIFDPLSNILASMQYAIRRYGSLSAAYNKAGGYDSGGIANGMGLMAKATLQPERVLSPRQTEAFEQWMSRPVAVQSREVSGSSGGGGVATMAPPNVTVQARVFVGDREITDIVRVESAAVVNQTISDQVTKARRR